MEDRYRRAAACREQADWLWREAQAKEKRVAELAWELSRQAADKRAAVRRLQEQLYKAAEACRQEINRAVVAQEAAKQEARRQEQVRQEEARHQEVNRQRHQQADHQEARQEIHRVVAEVEAAVVALHLPQQQQQQPAKQVRFLLATGR